MSLSYTDRADERRKNFYDVINYIQNYEIKKRENETRNILINMNNMKFQNITKSFNTCIVNKYVVISLTTTGTDAIKDEIVEISAIKYFDFKPIEQFHTFIKPLKALTDEQIRKVGITNEDIEIFPTIKEVIYDLDEYIRDFPIVCYNANFVCKFLYVNGSNVIDKLKYIYDVITIYKKAFDKIETLSEALKNLMKLDIENNIVINNYATSKIFEKCIYLITENDDKFFEKNVDIH